MSIVGIEPINNGKDVILSDDILAVWATLAQKQVPGGTPAFAKGVNVRKLLYEFLIKRLKAFY